MNYVVKCRKELDVTGAAQAFNEFKNCLVAYFKDGAIFHLSVSYNHLGTSACYRFLSKDDSDKLCQSPKEAINFAIDSGHEVMIFNDWKELCQHFLKQK